MELVEQYVQAVKQYLPEGQQNDIAAELAENIRAQMDDQAEAAGRPLTEAEQEAILKRMGNPAIVAGRYQTDPKRLSFGRELIGPVFFPIYTRVLLIAGTLMLLGNFLAAFLARQSFSASLSAIVLNAVIQFTIITGIFIAAQAHLTRYPDLWNPQYPKRPVMAPKNERLVPRFESLVDVLIIMAVVFMIRSFPVSPVWVAELGLGTVWQLGYWSAFGLTLASIVPPIIAFICPSWTVFRAAARVVIGVLWLGILVYLLTAGPWATGAAPSAGLSAEALALTQTINRWLPWGLGLVAVLSALEIGFDVWKLMRQVRLQKA